MQITSVMHTTLLVTSRFVVLERRHDDSTIDINVAFEYWHGNYLVVNTHYKLNNSPFWSRQEDVRAVEKVGEVQYHCAYVVRMMS